MNDKWLLRGTDYFPIPGDTILTDTPGPGVWETVQNLPDPSIGLRKVCDSFSFDHKIYDTGGKEIIERTLALWNNKTYKKTGKNLGIILNGIKGTG